MCKTFSASVPERQFQDSFYKYTHSNAHIYVHNDTHTWYTCNEAHLYILLWLKCSISSIRWPLKHLVVFNFIQNNFVILYCGSCHISIHSKIIKIAEFLYSHFNTDAERKRQLCLHIMLYYFKKGKTATETQKMICALCGEGAVTKWTCQKWFLKFCTGNLLLDNAPCLGSPIEVDKNQFKILNENNQHCTMKERAKILKIAKSTVKNHLLHLGYANSYDVWGPHKFSEKNLFDRISACTSLLKQWNVPFLK